MIGLGETKDETIEAMQDLRNNGVSILTLGQYLQPTRKHLAVERYITPAEFEEFREIGLNMGFRFVESGPMVRSSYHAEKHVL
jgi:lipoic acid synthetase